LLFLSETLVKNFYIFLLTSKIASTPVAGDQGPDRCAIFSSFPGQIFPNSIQDFFRELVFSARGDVFIENPLINDDTFFDILDELERNQLLKINIITSIETNGIFTDCCCFWMLVLMLFYLFYFKVPP
jgi:hypothetical protein